MEPEVVPASQGRYGRNGVHYPVRVRRRRANEEDCPLRNRRLHGLYIGRAIGICGRVNDFEAQVVRRLVNSRMGGNRRYDFHLGEVWPLLHRIIPRRFERQKEALRPPTGHRAAAALRPVHEAAHNLHHFPLHLPQAGEGHGVEGIFRNVEAVNLLNEFMQFGTVIINQAPGPASEGIDVMLFAAVDFR